MLYFSEFMKSGAQAPTKSIEKHCVFDTFYQKVLKSIEFSVFLRNIIQSEGVSPAGLARSGCRARRHRLGAVGAGRGRTGQGRSVPARFIKATRASNKGAKVM